MQRSGSDKVNGGSVASGDCPSSPCYRRALTPRPWARSTGISGSSNSWLAMTPSGPDSHLLPGGRCVSREGVAKRHWQYPHRRGLPHRRRMLFTRIQGNAPIRLHGCRGTKPSEGRSVLVCRGEQRPLLRLRGGTPWPRLTRPSTSNRLNCSTAKPSLSTSPH